jgi:inward rectifier potassium channel
MVKVGVARGLIGSGAACATEGGDETMSFSGVHDCTARAMARIARCATAHRDYNATTMADSGEPSDVVVVGVAAHPLRDAYHLVLGMRWRTTLAGIAGAFLLINAVFACGYVVTGGVGGARPGSFPDAFFFSVQTMGTVGYGAMHPVSTAANVLVVAECIVGLIVTALATGVVFARFSRTTGVFLFSRNACVAPIDGMPTLHFRVGNDRSSTIFEARVSVTMLRTERTLEGVVFYRMHDLTLVRHQSPAMARSFTVMHRLTGESPLAGATRQSCIDQEVEIRVSVVGTDGTSLQPVHAQRRYEMKDILWGARLADILSELPDGRVQLDIRKFHDTVKV